MNTQDQITLLRDALERLRAAIERADIEQLVEQEYCAANAALAAPVEQPTIEGWKLVPDFPTAEMIRVGDIATSWDCVTLYNTMLAAAPPAPQQRDDGKDAKRLRGLRQLCGYVEDGSSDTVSIVQDDATREWIVRVGKKNWYHGESMMQTIDAAIAAKLKEPT